jgi:hypothetical protein
MGKGQGFVEEASGQIKTKGEGERRWKYGGCQF